MSTTFPKSTVRTVDTLTDIIMNFVTVSLAFNKITVVGFNVVHCSFYAYIYCVTQYNGYKNHKIQIFTDKTILQINMHRMFRLKYHNRNLVIGRKSGWLTL